MQKEFDYYKFFRCECRGNCTNESPCINCETRAYQKEENLRNFIRDREYVSRRKQK